MIRIKYLLLMIFLCVTGLPVSWGQSSTGYDEEIDRIIRKMLQYPGRTQDLDKLKDNFDQANLVDKSRIEALLSTGQPDIYYDVYQAYTVLDNRQKAIVKLPEDRLQQAGIQLSDYQRPLAESRQKASAYLYAHGKKLLQSSDPAEIRLAYAEFIKLAGMSGSYKDLDRLIRQAVLKGATNVEFELYNRTGKPVSSTVTEQLSVIIWEFKKARYGQVKPAQTDNSFAFILRVILDDLEVGPDQVRELEYQEERDIYRDGQTVDTISCLVRETRQLKKAHLNGSLEYADKQTGRVINRIPVRVESIFSNAYASLQGDPGAAGDATRELLKSRKAAYPSSEQMVLDATEEFAKKAAEVILAE